MSFSGVEDFGERRAQFLLHGVEHLVVGVAEIDCEENFAGHDVAAVRLVLDHADGADRVRRVLERNRIDPLDHARGAKERVLAKPHRRGAGMRLLAGDRDLVPAHALHALHNADHFLLVFEDRALLDVQFEHGGEFAGAGFLRAAIADAGKLVAKGFAVTIGAGVSVIAA